MIKPLKLGLSRSLTEDRDTRILMAILGPEAALAYAPPVGLPVWSHHGHPIPGRKRSFTPVSLCASELKSPAKGSPRSPLTPP